MKTSISKYFLLLIIGFQIFSYAQTLNTEILQVKFYYDDVAFEEAIETGTSLLKSSQVFTENELSFLHQYIALSFYNIGKLDSARSHFLSLLTVDQNMELDPVNTSPKIIDFFDDIKKDYAALAATPQSTAFTKYVFVDDLRPSAGLRSIILPGWGQFHKRQSTKGFILGGAFWSSLIATGIAAIREDQTHENYLDSRTPQDIETSYDTYNQWFKTRRFLTTTTIVLWVLTAGDAFITPYAQPTLVVNRNGEAAVGINIKF